MLHHSTQFLNESWCGIVRVQVNPFNSNLNIHSYVHEQYWKDSCIRALMNTKINLLEMGSMVQKTSEDELYDMRLNLLKIFHIIVHTYY